MSLSLRLVIESAPRPQAVSERTFAGGRLSIGRSEDADWQLDDPKMFVSRRHCVLSEEDGQVMVTDASSGGLFIDNASSPLGTGNSTPIAPGMRLHLGDFILRVEAAEARAEAPPAPTRTTPARGFFADEPPAPPPEPPAPRPKDLPDPFGLRTDKGIGERHKEVARPPRPLDQRDPFGLDLRTPRDEAPESDADAAPRPAPGGYFGTPSERSSPDPAPAEPERQPRKPDIFGSWDIGGDAEEDVPSAKAAPVPTGRGSEEPAPRDVPLADPLQPEPRPWSPPPEPQATEPSAAPTPDPSPAPRAEPRPPLSGEDGDLRDALLRGMGLDPREIPAEDPAAEMENLGRCMRDLVEGVMLLLRTRAQEKQKVRVAQTIISNADVNPLKFLATPEDAMAALVRPRGRGYLPPQEAVQHAFRDLTDHQLRTWSALQTALRRMIDRFDPEEIEREMADIGLLEALVAGGRKAKLWQIYEDRYRDIAQSAEKQFLGDVGADFRDAYENKGR